MASSVYSFLGIFLELLKENSDEMTSAEEVYEAVGDHIQSSVNGLSDDDVQDICDKLVSILHKGYGFL